MKTIQQPAGLISVLLDKTARDDERHDAAMDLSLYPEDDVMKALYKVITDKNEDDLILDACGESIAIIWISRGRIDQDCIKNFSNITFAAAKRIIKGIKPEWLIYFEK